MKLFDLDLDQGHRRYQKRGWVHTSPGVTPEFLAYLTDTVDARIGAGSLEGPGLAGAKEQFLLDFPPELDLEEELFEPVAKLFGLDRSRLTLSERHLKVYDADADPDPLPHKDRLASTVSLGITIRAPDGTRAFLHPQDERAVNPFMGPHLLNSLPIDGHPATALDANSAVEIQDRPGDVLAFAGSSIWHGRRDAAGAVLLYLKFNDFGADPLGEDPRTEGRVRRSQELLGDATGALSVELGPRLVSVAERAVPPNWESVTVVELWDASPLWLSEIEERVLRRASSGPTIDRLADELGERTAIMDAVRRLATAGALVVTH